MTKKLFAFLAVALFPAVGFAQFHGLAPYRGAPTSRAQEIIQEKNAQNIAKQIDREIQAKKIAEREARKKLALAMKMTEAERLKAYPKAVLLKDKKGNKQFAELKILNGAKLYYSSPVLKGSAYVIRTSVLDKKSKKIVTDWKKKTGGSLFVKEAAKVFIAKSVAPKKPVSHDF